MICDRGCSCWWSGRPYIFLETLSPEAEGELDRGRERFVFFFFFSKLAGFFRSVARKKKRPTIPCVVESRVCFTVPRYDRADDYYVILWIFRILLVTTRRIADDTRCWWTGWLSAGCRNSSHPRRARSLARGTRIGLTRRASVLRPEDTPHIDRNLPRSGRNEPRRGISVTITRARQGQTSAILRHEGPRS